MLGFRRDKRVFGGSKEERGTSAPSGALIAKPATLRTRIDGSASLPAIGNFSRNFRLAQFRGFVAGSRTLEPAP